MRQLALGLASLLLITPLAGADDPPQLEHQPAICTVPEKPLSLCATISDDGTVSAARLFFRRPGDEYYAFVDMAFTGVSYCATVPAPRKKTKAIEYYLQAVDDAYQPKRTNTYQIQVNPSCDFPPLETDPVKAAAIKVFATNKKQGDELGGGFVPAGVSFVPVGR